VSVLSAFMRRAQKRANEAEAQVKAEHALRKSEYLLKSMGRMAKVGGWELDLQTMGMLWTEETFRIHEIYPEVCPELDDALEFYAPEARPVLQEAIKQASENGIPYDLVLPFITAKGNRLWVRAMGNAERQEGKTIRLYGTFQDVTDHKRLQEAQAATIQLLRICNGATDKAALTHELTRIFQQITGCEAI